MVKILDPSHMGEAVAEAFNSRNLEDLVSLYEPNATLIVNQERWEGIERIRATFEGLLQMPGAMSLRINFCAANGDLALLRTDWTIRNGTTTVMTGSSVELVRRQEDGSWLYVIDHATGASLPSLEG